MFLSDLYASKFVSFKHIFILYCFDNSVFIIHSMQCSQKLQFVSKCRVQDRSFLKQAVEGFYKRMYIAFFATKNFVYCFQRRRIFFKQINKQSFLPKKMRCKHNLGLNKTRTFLNIKHKVNWYMSMTIH